MQQAVPDTGGQGLEQGARIAVVACASAGLALIAALLVLAGADALWSAPATVPSPFSVGVSEGGGHSGGIAGWIIATQSSFYAGLTTALQGISAGAGGTPWLAGMAFLYGVFHAAGPGHGKAVIAAWMFADGARLGQGIRLAAAAALLQAAVAIALVGFLGGLLRLTSGSLTHATAWVEAGSFVAVALVGGLLLSRKSLQLGRILVGRHARHREDGSCCGHLPRQGGVSWASSPLATVAAAGLRPCSGGIIVLVFALSQGTFATGVIAVLAMAAGTALTTASLAGIAVHAKSFALGLASGDGRTGLVALRAVEVAASAMVCALGIALATGIVAKGGL